MIPHGVSAPTAVRYSFDEIHARSLDFIRRRHEYYVVMLGSFITRESARSSFEDAKVAAAEMCMAGRVGMSLELDGAPITELFSESLGRLLVTTRTDDLDALLEKVPDSKVVGSVISPERLEVSVSGRIVVDLAQLWRRVGGE